MRKKRHDYVRPNLGNYGPALTFVEGPKISNHRLLLAAGGNDGCYMRQLAGMMDSVQVQHASGTIGETSFLKGLKIKETLGILWRQQMLRAEAYKKRKSNIVKRLSDALCWMIISKLPARLTVLSVMKFQFGSL